MIWVDAWVVVEGAGMSRKVTWGLGFVVFLVVLAAAWFALQKKYDMDIAPESYSFVDRFERDGVPDIEVPAIAPATANGKANANERSAKDGPAKGAHQLGVLRLGDIKEPIVIVNFWASWCNPCVEEFPSMLKLVEALDGKVAIVAVSMDDELNDLTAFSKLFGVPRKGFYVGWDEKKKVMEDYGVGKLPESYIVGRDRKLIRKVLGIENWASENAIAYFKELAQSE